MASSKEISLAGESLSYNIRFNGFNYEYFLKYPFWAVWMYLYRREFLINSNVLFREDITHSEDALFNAEYLLADEYYVLSVDTKLYNYTFNPSSLTHNYKKGMAAKRLDHYLPIFKYYNNLVVEKSLRGAMLERMRYLSLKNLPNAVAIILNSQFSYSQVKYYCDLLLSLDAVFYSIPVGRSIKFYQFIITHPKVMYCIRLIRTNYFVSHLYSFFK